VVSSSKVWVQNAVSVMYYQSIFSWTTWIESDRNLGLSLCIILKWSAQLSMWWIGLCRTTPNPTKPHGCGLLISRKQSRKEHRRAIIIVQCFLSVESLNLRAVTTLRSVGTVRKGIDIYTNITTCNNCDGRISEFNLEYIHMQGIDFLWYAWRNVAKLWYMNRFCDILSGTWQSHDIRTDMFQIAAMLYYIIIAYNAKSYNHMLLYYSNICVGNIRMVLNAGESERKQARMNVCGCVWARMNANDEE